MPERVRLRNTGTRRGREVIQVYLAREDSAIERPVRWLAGFTAVEPGAGQETTVEVNLPAGAFAHWDIDTQKLGDRARHLPRRSRTLPQATSGWPSSMVGPSV